jgi:phosphatidylglycerol:prolipoprotein diacylglycerol transferase
MPKTVTSPYSWLMLAGIGLSLLFWSRLVKRDRRLFWIYVSALTGAFVGAKLVYILAEGWLHFGAADAWIQLATGKSILGGLLGGYAGVELAKRWLSYTSATGDWFALIVPVGIMVGRIGCWAHGCCRGVVCAPPWFALSDASGVARWPAVPVELMFNFIALLSILLLRRRNLFPGQHFHLYLIAYGAFRFFHEFLREEPRILGPLSGYQFAALAVAILGGTRFISRRNEAPDLTLLNRA